MEDKKGNAQPSDATGVTKPDNPKQEEKVAATDAWAGNSAVEWHETHNEPMSSQEEADVINDGLVNRRSTGTRYSEIPPLQPTSGTPEKTYDVPIDPDIKSKQVDWRDDDERH